jgi:hypothetical protein
MIIPFWNRFYDNDCYQESYNVGGFHLNHFMLFVQSWERPTQTRVGVTVPNTGPCNYYACLKNDFSLVLQN